MAAAAETFSLSHSVILTILSCFRCCHVTDIGIGYISTMLALNTLYLRWCSQIRDFGLQHICGMRSMQILSLAGKTMRLNKVYCVTLYCGYNERGIM